MHSGGTLSNDRQTLYFITPIMAGNTLSRFFYHFLLAQHIIIYIYVFITFSRSNLLKINTYN